MSLSISPHELLLALHHQRVIATAADLQFELNLNMYRLFFLESDLLCVHQCVDVNLQVLIKKKKKKKGIALPCVTRLCNPGSVLLFPAERSSFLSKSQEKSLS